MIIHYAADCSCAASRALADGTLPEYYVDEMEAAGAFAARYARLVQALREERLDDRYWAVHWRGRHLIAVHVA